MKERNTSLIKASLLSLILIATLPFAFAQVTCPADGVVWSGYPSVVLSGAGPSGGVYSGPWVSEGKFYSGSAGLGEHTITYTAPDGQSSCSFKLTVVDFTCNLDYAIINLNGPPWKITACYAFPEIPIVWSGPGIANNILDPSQLEGAYSQMTPALEGADNPDWFPVIRPFQILLENGPNTRITKCIGDIFVSSATDPAFELPAPEYPIYPETYHNWKATGPGISTSPEGKFIFDPSVAGLGAHVITVEVVNFPFINNTDYCNFTVAVGPLPVKIKEFSLSGEEGGLRINWETVSETDFDRFEVERSTDIRKGFSKIAAQEGGSLSGRYFFVDENVPRGIPVYYRLKMLDRDGSFSYSKIESTFMDIDNHVLVYPNPASGFINIRSETAFDEIVLLNSSGIEVWKKRTSNTKTADISLPALSTGIYLVRLSGKRDSYHYSKILIK